MLKLADIEQPHNLDAERALLGSLMLDSDLFVTISERIGRDSFYNTTHQYIFESISSLFLKQKPIDTISITQQIKELGHDVELKYLASLPDTVPLSSNLSYYAGIIEDLSKRRQAMRIGIELINMASTLTTKLEDIYDEVQASIHYLSQDVQDTKTGLHPLGDQMDAGMDFIEEQFNKSQEQLKNGTNEPLVYGLATRLEALDNVTAGLALTDLTILAARPSMGKTQLALNIASNIAQADIPVALFSIEMSSVAVGLREIGKNAGVSVQLMKKGIIHDDQFAKIGYAAGHIKNLPFLIDEKSNIDVNYIRKEVMYHNLRNPNKPLQLVIIDYLQLMRHDYKHGISTNDAVGATSRALKGIAKDFNCHVLLLSQLNRETDKRADKRPIMSDIRDSGNIEQDADNIIFIHREHYYDKAAYSQYADITIAKNRNGPTDNIQLSFSPETGRFSDMSQGDFVKVREWEEKKRSKKQYTF